MRYSMAQFPLFCLAPSYYIQSLLLLRCVPNDMEFSVRIPRTQFIPVFFFFFNWDARFDANPHPHTELEQRWALEPPCSTDTFQRNSFRIRLSRRWSSWWERDRGNFAYRHALIIRAIFYNEPKPTPQNRWLLTSPPKDAVAIDFHGRWKSISSTGIEPRTRVKELDTGPLRHRGGVCSIHCECLKIIC